MPTKKRRVGFIPRGVVLDLINKLSFECNLSNSKIINILVEEALTKRGMLSIKTEEAFNYRNNTKNQLSKENINKEFNYKYNYDSTIFENMDTSDEILDKEIYSKFLMFLQFQERMKNKKP